MLCTHYLTESLQWSRKWHHHGISPTRKQAWGSWVTAPGYTSRSFEPGCASGCLTPHHAEQTLLICSYLFLQSLTGLNISHVLVDHLHFLFCSFLVAAFLMLTWYLPASQGLSTTYASTCPGLDARQAPFILCISHSGNSRSLGQNPSTWLLSYALNQKI